MITAHPTALQTVCKCLKEVVAQATLLVDYFGSHSSKDWGDCNRSKFLFSHVKIEENESDIFVPQLDAVSI